MHPEKHTLGQWERKHKDMSIVVFQYVCKVAGIHEATAHERMNLIHQTPDKHSNKKFIIVQFVVFCTFYAVDRAQPLMQIVLYSVTPLQATPRQCAGPWSHVHWNIYNYEGKGVFTMVVSEESWFPIVWSFIKGSTDALQINKNHPATVKPGWYMFLSLQERITPTCYYIQTNPVRGKS